MIPVFMALIERVGVRAAGIIVLGAGIIQIVPKTLVPPYIVQGVVWCAAGLGMIFFGQKLQSAQRQYVAVEAEKRRLDPTLPSESQIPAVQREIEKQDAAAGTGGA